MKIIDSNIIIYSVEPRYSYLRPLVNDAANAISAITRVEVLGFPLTSAEEIYFESIFITLQIISLDDFILNKRSNFVENIASNSETSSSPPAHFCSTSNYKPEIPPIL